MTRGRLREREPRNGRSGRIGGTSCSVFSVATKPGRAWRSALRAARRWPRRSTAPHRAKRPPAVRSPPMRGSHRRRRRPASCRRPAARRCRWAPPRCHRFHQLLPRSRRHHSHRPRRSPHLRPARRLLRRARAPRRRPPVCRRLRRCSVPLRHHRPRRLRPHRLPRPPSGRRRGTGAVPRRRLSRPVTERRRRGPRDPLSVSSSAR